MKPTEDIIKNLDIDRYLLWIRDIYNGVARTQYLNLHETMINEMKLQEFRVTSYYSFKWMDQEQKKRITNKERIEKETRLNTAFHNREKLKIQENQVTELEQYLDFMFHFVKPGKWKEGQTTLKNLAKYIVVDLGNIDYFISTINSYYNTDIQDIERKADVNKAIREKIITERFEKEYVILEYIADKTFFPVFGNYTNDFPLEIFMELAELKTLSTLVDEKSNYHNEVVVKWTGKVTQLGFIVRELVEKGYIDSPKKKNGEVNETELARLINQVFRYDGELSTLTKSLSMDGNNMENSNKNKFIIPHIKEIS